MGKNICTNLKSSCRQSNKLVYRNILGDTFLQIAKWDLFNWVLILFWYIHGLIRTYLLENPWFQNPVFLWVWFLTKRNPQQPVSKSNKSDNIINKISELSKNH